MINAQDLWNQFAITEKDYVPEYYEPGEVVIKQGCPAEYLRLIVRGSVNIPVNASNGNEYLIRYSLMDSILGNVELFTNDSSYIYGATAVTELEVAAIPMQRARALLEENFLFFRRIAEDLACKMKRTTQDILAAQTRTAEERLCFYLLEMAEDDIYKAPLTTAASSTGVTYRHTWRMMQKLCEDGLLSKEQDGYHITDRQALTERAWKSG
ncbi:MAG: cyclic nucleotide-binding domain-containing protein [Candidatus Choladocola sp.]|nr:cyclic nucleotide-binding domain-containing protein [Candidatus Choladocola sp.]